MERGGRRRKDRAKKTVDEVNTMRNVGEDRTKDAWGNREEWKLEGNVYGKRR